MIRSGTTRFFDMYWHAAETARAAEHAGVRLVATTAVIDAPSSPGRGTLREEWIEEVDRLGEFGPLVTPSLGPHAIYTVGRETLEWVAEVTAERELAVQVHLSETEQEVHDCVEANGKRPAFYLDEVGLLGPRTALAHGVWLDIDELELVSARGATVVSNPAANMKLAVGRAFPYPEAARAGVPLALGTDGVSSNSNLDLFEEMKLFSLLQKHTTGDPAALPASEALAIARGQRSPLMAGAELAPGQPADFLLLRTSDPELSVGDPDALLVYGATGSIVDTTVVAGRVLMQEREVADADQIVAEVRARSKRLTS
jgi:5-methylthioadenosine/S-adenosylhomocysteine deaminase